MKRPNAAGSVLQALEPVANKLELFAIVRMLSRMVQNLKTRAPRKARRNPSE
jgi:hypothetical protein